MSKAGDMKNEGRGSVFMPGGKVKGSVTVINYYIVNSEEANDALPEQKSEITEAVRLAEQRKAEEERRAKGTMRLVEEQCKKEEAHNANQFSEKVESPNTEKALTKEEKIEQDLLLPPDYPTLENYNKSEFEIEETVLKKYLRKEVSGEVKIPFGVTSIEDKAFEGCGNLTSIIIPSSVTEIKAFAFAYCSGLTSITILDGVTLIDSCAFRNCIKLTSIKIPNSVKTIGYGAFMVCSELISITIGSSVTEIGENSFADCNQLKCIQVATESTVYKSEGNCLIDIKSNQLVLGCGGSCIPEYVTSIGPSAFQHGGLTSITIPNSVTSIWQWAFANCRGLTSIAIPESVTAIGAGAFCSCSGLTSVFIPKSVTRLGEAAFERCGNLKIYCATKEQPQGWEKNWNPDNRPVVWSYNKK